MLFFFYFWLLTFNAKKSCIESRDRTSRESHARSQLSFASNFLKIPSRNENPMKITKRNFLKFYNFLTHTLGMFVSCSLLYNVWMNIRVGFEDENFVMRAPLARGQVMCTLRLLTKRVKLFCNPYTTSTIHNTSSSSPCECAIMKYTYIYLTFLYSWTRENFPIFIQQRLPLLLVPFHRVRVYKERTQQQWVSLYSTN